MQVFFWLGFTLISVAAADYLLRRFRDIRRQREYAKQVDAALNPPEAVIARELGKARRTLPPEEYADLEKAVFAEIEKNNAAIEARNASRASNA